jgi:thymidine phosphorylase
MDEVGRRLASIPRAQANAYEVVLLRAVYLFVRDRNVRAALAARALRSGVGLAKLRELVVAQGGDPRVIDEPSLLTKGAAFLPVSLDASGYVSSIDARQIGEIVRELKSAAGERKCLCGVLVEKKVGDGIGAGEAVAAVVVPDAVPAEAVERAKGEVCGAFRVSDARPRRQRLLAAVVGGGTGTAHHPQMNTDER